MSKAATDTPNAEPKARKGISVRMDEIFARDLEIFARTGMNATDAVKYAVNQIAAAYERAWEQGLAAQGEVPEELKVVTIREYQDLAAKSVMAS